jgi:polysaccharide export outer membrane protein
MKIILILILALLLFSCSSNYKMTSQPETAAARRTTFSNNMDPVVVSEYRLGFGDVLEIKFFNNEQFNENVTVRPDGRISLEIVGDIFVAGMTPSQLDSLITITYREIVKNPDVTVFVREFSGYQVYVLGQVNKPGGIALQRNMTLLHALAAAEGVTDGGELNSVMLLRRGAGNQLTAFKFDLTKPFQGSSNKITERDIYVQPLDIVYVPKTFIYSSSTFLKMLWDGLLPPVDVALRALYWYDQPWR